MYNMCISDEHPAQFRFVRLKVDQVLPVYVVQTIILQLIDGYVRKTATARVKTTITASSTATTSAAASSSSNSNSDT